MASRTISLPSGFEDRDPSIAVLEQRLRQSFFQHCTLYGFRSIYVSPVSFSPLFLEQNDGAREWVYTFQDKAGRELILNPDSLPAVLRCFANSGTASSSATRWTFCAPIFRYKRVKQRHYHHLGALFINESSVYFEELIADLVIEFLLSEFSRKFHIKLNNFDLWLDLFKLYEVPEHVTRQILYTTNSMAMNERLNYIETTLENQALQDMLKSLATVEASLPEVTLRNRLESILPAPIHHHIAALWKYALDRQKQHQRLGITVDLHDFHAGAFHDGIAFQILTDPDLPRIGDGGSYHTYSKKIHSSIQRVSSTVLRLEDTARLYNEEPCPSVVQLFLYNMQPDQSTFAELVRSLRASGISIWEDMSAKTVAVALKRAINVGATYFSVLGEQELATHCIEIKELANHKKYQVPWTEITQVLLSNPSGKKQG